MAELKWRAEFYKPGPGTTETLVGHVDGDAKTVGLAEPPAGAYSKFKLLTPPDIRVGDHVRYDNHDDEPFVAVVTRVGTPYPSGTFNVDLLRDGVAGTVFCENCTVIFRPRHRSWKEDELLALFPKASGISTETLLFGKSLGKFVKILQIVKGSWTVSFWLDGRQVDSKDYSEKDYGYLRDLLRATNTWLFEEPVKVGDCWAMTINQGLRDVEVVMVKKLRYRIEYEMPNAGMMGSWQTGILIGGKLYKR